MKHTQTRIYQLSLELTRGSKGVLDELPKGYAFLADQLRRAVASIPLNYAEGCGKQYPKDRRRFFVQARGSANEVIAILDVAHCFGVIAHDRHGALREMADHLAAMLSRFK